MEYKLNWKEIRERYLKYYEHAVMVGSRNLPCYEIQQWDRVLNPVGLKIFNEIKCLGMPLYPFYTIEHGPYVSFGNPFNKVGIEVLYKDKDYSDLKRKIELLKTNGWTIYETTSKGTYRTFEEYYSFHKGTDTVYEDLDDDERFDFLDTYKDRNTDVLLKYIQSIHFDNYDYGIKNNYDDLLLTGFYQLSTLNF